jgi:hypothetical protein
MTMRPCLVLHIGLPRTGTTVLQRHIFPAATGIHYAGKLWSNSTRRYMGRPVVELARHATGHARAELAAGRHDGLQELMGALVFGLRSVIAHGQPAREVADALRGVLLEIAAAHADRPTLYSDESLMSSAPGSLGSRMGPKLPLDVLHRTGLLEDAVVSVTLREPVGFLKASWYKANEIRIKANKRPLSIPAYIDFQLRLLREHRRGSRLFLAMHDELLAHLHTRCPRLVVNRYEDLLEEPHVLDAIMGFPTGSPAIRLSHLPRENNSFRDAAVEAFIRQAPGVPPDLSVEEYARGFEDHLRRAGLAGPLKLGAS